MAVLIGCTPVETDRTPVTEQGQLEETIQQRLDELFRMAENRDGYRLMDQVSYDYLGNRTTLESDVIDQFSHVDSIDYEYFIDELSPGEDHAEVEFHWDRRWRDVDTGNETRNSGTTTFRLVKSDGTWMIKDIRGTNPFL